MSNKEQTTGWGFIDNNCFHKKVKKSKHFIRNFQSWGLDYKLYMDKISDCKVIILQEVEEGKYYISTPGLFNEFGFLRDFGFGVQHFLGIKHWQVASTPSEMSKIVSNILTT